MEKENYVVRRAEWSDLEVLVSFAVQEAKEAEGIELSLDYIRRGIGAALENESLGRFWILTRENREAVGNISVIKEWSNWRGGFYWWIQSLFILREFRGAGLMQKLIDAVKDAAHNGGAIDLRLYVHGQNERAIKAYNKVGFSESAYRIMRMSV